MATSRIVPHQARFLLTEYGREALRARETCECEPRPDGGLLVCPKCGTVWSLPRYQSSRGMWAWKS